MLNFDSCSSVTRTGGFLHLKPVLLHSGACFAQLSMVADELWVVTPGKSKAPPPKAVYRGFNLKPCGQDVPGRVTVFEGSFEDQNCP